MKTVQKPWGHEVWLELNDKYCFKIINVTEGHRLSLQYHQYKTETLLLISGSATMIIDDDEIVMAAGDYRTIQPGTKHRIHAITNCVFAEASTPEVTDVVRIEDDYNRE